MLSGRALGIVVFVGLEMFLPGLFFSSDSYGDIKQYMWAVGVL